jgi:predicted oxidoreductase (fatty acid repression mutant protein)
MADRKSFLDTVRDRHSYYALSKESPISDDRIRALALFTIKNSPSAFNVQVNPLPPSKKIL